MTDAWNTADIPSQAGRVAIVTGATSGLGLECARALAIAGAEAVIAARDMAKAARVMTDIHQTHPHADVECRQLDTARLAGALMQASASHKHLALKYQRLGRWTRCDRPLKGREAASDPRALKPIRDPRDEDVSAFALQDSDPPAISSSILIMCHSPGHGGSWPGLACVLFNAWLCSRRSGVRVPSLTLAHPLEKGLVSTDFVRVAASHLWSEVPVVPLRYTTWSYYGVRHARWGSSARPQVVTRMPAPRLRDTGLHDSGLPELQGRRGARGGRGRQMRAGWLGRRLLLTAGG
jgi:hypothetical protein